MEHTHIVQAADLSRYADTRDSQGVIPELVYLLIRQSTPNATACRIPYGDAVNQPGLDGIVECEDGLPCSEIHQGQISVEDERDSVNCRVKIKLLNCFKLLI